MKGKIFIRSAHEADKDAVWEIIRMVIKKGDTYAFAPDSSRKSMIDYWFGQQKHTYVADWNGEVAGTYVLQANQPGLGSHIANGAYRVSLQHHGLGIGTAIGQHSLEEARRLGFKAMQFNMVIKSNQAAVHLWKKLGFCIIGEIPNAFQHKELGLINAYIMYRAL